MGRPSALVRRHHVGRERDADRATTSGAGNQRLAEAAVVLAALLIGERVAEALLGAPADAVLRLAEGLVAAGDDRRGGSTAVA